MATTLLAESRAGDSAQALMDLGSTICTPKKPACAICPIDADCASRARGDQDTFPRKAPKKAGILRRGAAFVVTRGNNEILLRTRPDKGLLGGMTEVPTTAWAAEWDEATALSDAPAFANARWQRCDGVVNHVFTHFPLDLIVYVAQVPIKTKAPNGNRWGAISELANEALPNLMRKVIAHGLGQG